MPEFFIQYFFLSSRYVVSMFLVQMMIMFVIFQCFPLYVTLIHSVQLAFTVVKEPNGVVRAVTRAQVQQNVV